MFYSVCKKCGTTRRWFYKDETAEPTEPLSFDELKRCKKVVKIHCAGCAPKKKTVKDD